MTNVVYKGNRKLLLTGSEDGRLVAWDMNSQKVMASRQMSLEDKQSWDVISNSELGPTKAEKCQNVIRSVDCSNGTVAISNGGEEVGVKVFSLECLLDCESARE